MTVYTTETLVIFACYANFVLQCILMNKQLLFLSNQTYSTLSSLITLFIIYFQCILKCAFILLICFKAIYLPSLAHTNTRKCTCTLEVVNSLQTANINKLIFVIIIWFSICLPRVSRPCCVKIVSDMILSSLTNFSWLYVVDYTQFQSVLFCINYAILYPSIILNNNFNLNSGYIEKDCLVLKSIKCFF